MQLGDKMKIGFIGLGRMGFALARSLLKNKQNVTVFDLNKDASAQLGSEGATVAADVPSLCQNVDLVFTMLPGPKQVKEVALGEQGVIHHLKAGSIYIDMSTIDVDTVDLLNVSSYYQQIVSAQTSAEMIYLFRMNALLGPARRMETGSAGYRGGGKTGRSV